MSIYFGGTTDEELISELRQRGFVAIRNNAEVVSKLRTVRVILENLPEQPGYNGSLLTIDDVEVDNVVADVSFAINALATEPSGVEGGWK